MSKKLRGLRMFDPSTSPDDDGSRSVPELSDLIDRAWLVAS